MNDALVDFVRKCLWAYANRAMLVARPDTNPDVWIAMGRYIKTGELQ
jgi:hypothetical protein